METTIKFSIFKEKIIKTNELLQLHLEKTKQLEKIQKCYQQLKIRFERSTSETNKLKLKNETLAYNLQMAEENYNPLKEEYGQLKLKFLELETESSNTINNLQINYQTANLELRECKEKLKALEREQDSVVKINLPGKQKKPPQKSAAENKLLNNKINRLQKDKEKLVDENGKLKLEIDELQNKLREVDELKANCGKFKQLEDALNMKQQELNKLETVFKTNIEKKDKEVQKLLKEVDELKLSKNDLERELKKLSDRDFSEHLCQEKQTLAAVGNCEEHDLLSNLSLPVIDEPMINKNNDTIPLHVITKECCPTDEEISRIMHEMVSPMCISPLESPIGVQRNITPVPEDNNCHATAAPPFLNNLQEMPTSASKKSDLMARAIKRRNLRKKKILMKKKSQNADLFEVLVKLKRANINFLISNNSLVQSTAPRMSSHFPDTRYPYTQQKAEKRCKNSVISELNCALACCKSYMLLKDNDDENAPLLGFFDVKDEISGQPQNRIGLPLTPPCRCSKKDRCFGSPNIFDICNSESGVKGNDKNKKRNIPNLLLQNSNKSSATKNRRLYALKPNISNSNKEQISKGTERVLHVTNNLDNTERATNRVSVEPVTPKSSFKRPVCSMRRSPRLLKVKSPLKNNNSEECGIDNIVQKKTTDSPAITTLREIKKPECSKTNLFYHHSNASGITPLENKANATEIIGERPKSPPKVVSKISNAPVIIPLEKKKGMPKTAFKRPVCRTRRSMRLSSDSNENSRVEIGTDTERALSEYTESSIPLKQNENVSNNLDECPKSSVNNFHEADTKTPIIIPLEKREEIPKIAFERPICTTKRSMRLSNDSNENSRVEIGTDTEQAISEHTESSIPLDQNESVSDILDECPQSPVDNFYEADNETPIIIPLEKREEIPKTAFKRTRRSVRLSSDFNENSTDAEKIGSEHTESSIPLDHNEKGSEILDTCPQSPTESSHEAENAPIIIPLEQREELPKTTFKRPVCRTRRSVRLSSGNTQTKIDEDVEKIEEIVANNTSESSQLPTKNLEASSVDEPTRISVDNIQEKGEKMPTSKIEMLFKDLIIFSKDEEALNAVVGQFATQEPGYIAEAILQRVSVDYHDTPDAKYSPAPLMTDVQRTMLGFMSKLEKTNVPGVFDSYLTLAEQKLLTCTVLQEIGPVTRLYLAICKLQRNLFRMRKLCCDMFYFCGDLAVPFLFIVLTSWTEVLPPAADSNDMPLARVLVQIIYMKDCNKPGYNLLPLRDLLIKFYGYPTERWNENQFFVDLLYAYLRNPGRSSDFALLLYCKNRPEKWVYSQIEEHLKPIVTQGLQENFKATVIILIGNLFNRFSSKSEVNYLPKIREWLTSLIDETTPDVVKRSIYLCLNRLKKK